MNANILSQITATFESASPKLEAQHLKFGWGFTDQSTVPVIICQYGEYSSMTAVDKLTFIIPPYPSEVKQLLLGKINTYDIVRAGIEREYTNPKVFQGKLKHPEWFIKEILFNEELLESIFNDEFNKSSLKALRSHKQTFSNFIENEYQPPKLNLLQ